MRIAPLHEALSVVRAGARLGVGGGSATPRALLAVLPGVSSSLGHISVISGLLFDGYNFLKSEQSNIMYESWAAPRALLGINLDFHRYRHLPMSWYQACRSFGERPVDVALIQVSASQCNGRYSLGTSSGYVRPMVDSAGIVIAEVNKKMPYTYGSSEIEADRVDVAVEVDYDLPEHQSRRPSPAERVVASECARLIDKYSTIQVGVGALPDQVLRLCAKKGFAGSVYSLLTDAFMDVAENNSAVTAEVGEVLGTRPLYQWIHTNERVRMSTGLETHDPVRLHNDNSLAFLNSAVEIDLFAQVNSEYIDGALAGGASGAVDFLTAGANTSRISLVAFASQTATAGRSRIVPILTGEPASISRFHTGQIVTEWGSADLRQLSSRERCDAIIALAAPTERASLSAYAAANLAKFGS